MDADIRSGWAGAGGAAGSPADPVIQLSGVTKQYEDDGPPALRAVSLDIGSGRGGRGDGTVRERQVHPA